MSAEPSMEEILSSIKRIIAEEGEGPVRAARRAPRTTAPAVPPPPAIAFDDGDDDSEVLELSDPIAPEPAADVRGPAFDTADDTDTEVAQEQPAMATTSVDRSSGPRAATPAVETAEPIVSARAAEASRHSLDSLSRLMVRSDAPASDDNTLEGLVRAMLRPMLREWLDANLPALVETMVAGEIARITGQPR